MCPIRHFDVTAEGGTYPSSARAFYFRQKLYICPMMCVLIRRIDTTVKGGNDELFVQKSSLDFYKGRVDATQTKKFHLK